MCFFGAPAFVVLKSTSGTISTWRNELSKDGFPKLKDFALKMHSIFGNTYVCESTSFTMIKSNLKTEIEWQTKHWTIVSELRLATTNTGIDKEG